MNLFFLQSEVAAWSAKNFPNGQPYQPLLGVAEECGELCHAHLKAEQGIRGTPEEHLQAKQDAVGDIVIYLADYCERNKISLALSVATAWQEVSQRNWQKNPQNGK